MPSWAEIAQKRTLSDDTLCKLRVVNPVHSVKRSTVSGFRFDYCDDQREPTPDPADDFVMTNGDDSDFNRFLRSKQSIWKHKNVKHYIQEMTRILDMWEYERHELIALCSEFDVVDWHAIMDCVL